MSIFLFFIIIHLFNLINASQYGPNLMFQKPYSVDQELGNFCMSFSAGSTNQSYNRAGQLVPFFQEYGTETLFKRYIDPYVPVTDQEIIGTIDFAAQLAFQSSNFNYYKNIMHHMFFGIGTTVQSVEVQLTSIIPHLLTAPSREESQLLENFEAKLPKNMDVSGILSTYIELGYNQKFTNFQTISFLQLYVKGSIFSPEWLHITNLNFLPYPFTGNYTFSFPVTAIILLGISEHLSFGCYGNINPFQESHSIIPAPSTIPYNHVIVGTLEQGLFQPATIYSAAFYIEVHDFLKNFTTLAGVGSMYRGTAKFTPFNNTLIPLPTEDITINLNSSHNPWNILTLFIQADYNFASHNNEQKPTLSLFLTTPLTGTLYPYMNYMGGLIGFNFHYSF